MSEKSVESNSVPIQNNNNSSENNTPAFSRIRWGESYISLLLGALVVIVAAILGVFYVKMHQPKQELLPPATIARHIKLTITSEPSTKNQFGSDVTKEKNNTMKERVYIVQKNDNLWDIAQKIYGSGYSWISISQANHLANPGMVFSGNKLIIPSVSPIIVQHKSEQILPPIAHAEKITTTPTPSLKPTAIPTVAQQQSIPQNNPITGVVYIVKSGDSLWSIAVRAYNNGNRWIDIAKVNNLANPSIIHSGNILKIPHTQIL